MPIKFAVKIVGLYNPCRSDDLDLHSGSQLHLKLDNILTRSLIVLSWTIFKIYGIQTWHDGRLIMAYNYAHAHFDDLNLKVTVVRQR